SDRQLIAPLDSCTYGRGMRPALDLYSSARWLNTSASAIPSRQLEQGSILPMLCQSLNARRFSTPLCGSMSNWEQLRGLNACAPPGWRPASDIGLETGWGQPERPTG